jgi:hypothetical protein
VFGAGIFGTNGKEWLRQRKAASNIFTLRLLRDGMCPVFMKDARFVVDRLQAVAGTHRLILCFVCVCSGVLMIWCVCFWCAAAEGGSLDMQDLFLRFTMQSFCEIAFGEDVGLLQNKEPHPFPKAFDFGMVLITLICFAFLTVFVVISANGDGAPLLRPAVAHQTPTQHWNGGGNRKADATAQSTRKVVCAAQKRRHSGL